MLLHCLLYIHVYLEGENKLYNSHVIVAQSKGSIAMKNPPRFLMGIVLYDLLLYVYVICWPLCCLFTIYGFWLPLWYLQSLLSKYNWINVQDKYIYPIQFFGSFVQSILHSNLSHVSHPNGGVRASPLSNRSTTGIKVITNNTANIFCDSSEIKIQPER